MSKKIILDPLWIDKGSYFDSEYFDYILLDASMKYRKALEKQDIDYFYELLFHSLNLNNLAMNGNIFDAKCKKVLVSERILAIQRDLKKVYEIPTDIPTETVKVFKNANFVFLNIILDNMMVELDILSKCKLFHMNNKIHMEKDIFIITNMMGEKVYKIWKLSEDKRCNFGFSFNKIRNIIVPEIRQNILQEQLDKVDDPVLKTLKGSKNLCFVSIQEEADENLIAKVVKDTMLLNKGIARGLPFESTIISELYRLLWYEKVMPFTLDQWLHSKV